MTTIEMAQTGRKVYLLHGELERGEVPFCPACGQKMHIHGSRITMLRHLCFGSRLSAVSFEKRRYRCPCCGHTEMESVPFKADDHNITRELFQFTRDLLAYGFTNKEVSELTGLGKNTVKEIDLQRLKDKYTVDGKTLRKPEKQARFLGVDEFKLHNGYKYASLIIDMESGHILWLAHGKRKRTVYDFIDHVDEAWMDGVEAVACDMNSDFQKAFEERCPHIQPVFDYFHLVKNFNEKVVGAIRKDEEAAEGKVISRGGELFSQPVVVRKSGYVQRYEELIRQNQLFFTLDIIKDKLANAYKQTDEAAMAEEISDIMDICAVTQNKHLLWFRRILDEHFEGIIAHATFNISAGRIEGINNKIKTLRRKGYGYPDDDYFFLKLFDISRKPYIRNPSSHNFYD